MTSWTSIADHRLLVDEFRQRLAAARLRLARMAAVSDADLETLAARQSREAAEDAAVGTVGDLLARLQGVERRELEEIEAAQERLEAGAYGVCEACDKPISLGRLRATPAARICTLCHVKTEALE